MFCFGVFLLSVYFAYSLWGSTLSEFNTYARSFISCFSLFELGDNYSVNVDVLHEVKSGWAFVFIDFFIVGVLGVLFSFFTAIYYESYRMTLLIEATIFERNDEESKFYKSNRN